MGNYFLIASTMLTPYWSTIVLSVKDRCMNLYGNPFKGERPLVNITPLVSIVIELYSVYIFLGA